MNYKLLVKYFLPRNGTRSSLFLSSFNSYCLPILNIVEVVVAYSAQNITTLQEEDEGGGIGKRRQG